MEGEKTLFSFTDPTKHTVVRPNKKLSRAFNDCPSALGSHARVNNCNMNSSGGKVFIDCEQIERGGPNVLRRNFVADIDYRCVRADREYGALHRANEIILRAKISQESNDRHDGRFGSLQSGRHISSPQRELWDRVAN